MARKITITKKIVSGKRLKKKTGPKGHVYDVKIAKALCREISVSEKGIKKILKDNPTWPCDKIIFEWRLDYPEFAEMMCTAKRNQVERIVDEMMEIADDASLDTITKVGSDGKEYKVCDREWVARTKIRIDHRRWLVSKLVPKMYGDKIQNETTVTITHENALKEIE